MGVRERGGRIDRKCSSEVVSCGFHAQYVSCLAPQSRQPGEGAPSLIERCQEERGVKEKSAHEEEGRRVRKDTAEVETEKEEDRS
eukprot:5263821-Pleurochrysis_carterae.AAC.1